MNRPGIHVITEYSNLCKMTFPYVYIIYRFRSCEPVTHYCALVSLMQFRRGCFKKEIRLDGKRFHVTA